MGAEDRAVWRAARIERDALRSRLVVDPSDADARLRLAASYRAHDHLDQAGRWGLLIEGGATPLEKTLFARTVVRTGAVDRERLNRLLLLTAESIPAATDALAEFDELLAEETARLDSERTASEAAAAKPPLTASAVIEGLDGVARVMRIGIGVVAALASAVTVITAFVGVEDARLAARVGLMMTLIPVFGWSVPSLIVDVARRRWIGFALKVVIIAAAITTAALLPPSGDGTFPWETPETRP